MCIDGDGKTDVACARDGKLLAFLQQGGGTFAEQAQIIDPGVRLSPDHEANVRTGDGRSFEDLRIYRVHDFQELDGDGLADLDVREEVFESAIEQNSIYRIH